MVERSRKKHDIVCILRTRGGDKFLEQTVLKFYLQSFRISCFLSPLDCFAGSIECHDTLGETLSRNEQLVRAITATNGKQALNRGN